MRHDNGQDNSMAARQNVPKTRSSNGVTWFMDFACTSSPDQEDDDEDDIDQALNSKLHWVQNKLEPVNSRFYLCYQISTAALNN